MLPELTFLFIGSNPENAVSFYLAFPNIYFIFIYFKFAHVIINMTRRMLLQQQQIGSLGQYDCFKYLNNRYLHFLTFI